MQISFRSQILLKKRHIFKGNIKKTLKFTFENKTEDFFDTQKKCGIKCKRKWIITLKNLGDHQGLIIPFFVLYIVLIFFFFVTIS